MYTTKCRQDTSTAVADQNKTRGGKALPSVPVLQNKSKEVIDLHESPVQLSELRSDMVMASSDPSQERSHEKIEKSSFTSAVQNSRNNIFQRIPQQVKSPASGKVIQRVLTFSTPRGNNDLQARLNEAYAVGLQGEHPQLVFQALGPDPGYANLDKFNVVEGERPEHDGLGSQLIGKIIDDGGTHIYWGENRNDATPTDFEASSRGESTNGQILLQEGASAIELIHELIHTYHFKFDPWTIGQKDQMVPANADGSTETAEEASTVGLGQWAGFGLTENAFRGKMGLARRDKYTGWEEPH